MKFRVVDSNSQILPNTSGSWEAWLVRDNWDDFHFKTLFGAVLVGPDQDRLDLGGVKIANRGMQRLTAIQLHPIPTEFERLDDSFYSLGQGVEYYKELKRLPDDTRTEFFHAVRDIAFTKTLADEFKDEPAFQKSVFRFQNFSTVITQYHRIGNGGEVHEAFTFEYRSGAQLPLRFEVRPASSPPTNVHVLIGSNGVGKTTLLQSFEEAVHFPLKNPEKTLQFVHSEDGMTAFSNLCAIAFSAFDSFGANSPSTTNWAAPTYRYFGLKKPLPTPIDTASSNSDGSVLKNSTEATGAGPNYTHKSLEELELEFAAQITHLAGENLRRFSESLAILSTDPLIGSSLLANLCADPPQFMYAVKHTTAIKEEYHAMSSGHKIVLLAIAGLIRGVDEKTLVLIDEPETHLHPPLLSAFIRALSALLIDRNGVAVIATHSPVVLQEVPCSCVWKLSRFGESLKFERPSIETFGENVGTLTREVFGFQVSRTGFYQMLEELVEKHKSYDGVINALRGQLGAEGRALVQILLATRRDA